MFTCYCSSVVSFRYLTAFDYSSMEWYFHIPRYVVYCMKFVDMLLSFGVRPILVFDGCNLPSKREVEKSRRE